jgi:hypothetical protein
MGMFHMKTQTLVSLHFIHNNRKILLNAPNNRSRPDTKSLCVSSNFTQCRQLTMRHAISKIECCNPYFLPISQRRTFLEQCKGLYFILSTYEVQKAANVRTCVLCWRIKKSLTFRTSHTTFSFYCPSTDAPTDNYSRFCCATVI